MNITKVAFAALFAAIPAVVTLANETTPQAPRRLVVAVGEFTQPDGNVQPDVNDYAQLRSRIQHRLIGTRKFEIVERENIQQVLEEIRKNQAGLTNDNGAPIDGRLLAAGYIVYGRVLFYKANAAGASIVGIKTTSKNMEVELQLKIADAETGRILADKIVKGVAKRTSRTSNDVATAATPLSGEEMLRSAVDDAAALAVDAIRDLCYPAKVIRVDEGEVTVNVTGEEVNEGDLFTVYQAVEAMYDPDTGVYLGTEGKRLGRLRVDATGPMTSKFVPVGSLDISLLKPGCPLHRVSNAELNREIAGRDYTVPPAFR